MEVRFTDGNPIDYLIPTQKTSICVKFQSQILQKETKSAKVLMQLFIRQKNSQI